MTIVKPTEFLFHLYQVAVARAAAENCLPPYLTGLSHRNIHVVGAGKAAAAMAKTIERCVTSKTSGLVVTRYGHSQPMATIEVVEADHPLPDEQGIQAAHRIIKLASTLSQHDFVICAISGGASSLLSLPYPGIAFADKRKITQHLLFAGASIQEINCVRKHLSAIKGGRLMRHIFPAQALTLCISDVVGDDPSVIGSGPTVADSSTCSEVLDITSQYQVNIPLYITTMLKRNELETPKPFDSIFERSAVQIAVRPLDALRASAEMVTRHGIAPVMLGDAITGDTNQVAKQHAQIAIERLQQGSKDKPFVILSGGETTVSVTGGGRGGPNTQFILALALELQGVPDLYAIACDTDGIDGSKENAGARLTPSTLTRAEAIRLNPRRHLQNNDSYGFFRPLNDLITTGPTRTNVNDFRAIAYLPATD